MFECSAPFEHLFVLGPVPWAVNGLEKNNHVPAPGLPAQFSATDTGSPLPPRLLLLGENREQARVALKPFHSMFSSHLPVLKCHLPRQDLDSLNN